MEHVPAEILKQHLAPYLPPSDLCQLSTASKTLNAQLSLSLLPRRKILTQFIRTDHRNAFTNSDHGPYALNYGFEIPVPSGAACHSVTVTMRWRDQGWGERKGHFVIIASDKYPDAPRGPVVFASDVAPHSLESLRVTFAQQRNRTYHLWYVAGGGVRITFSLNLYEVAVEALILDDSSRSFRKAHGCLAKRNAFLTWDVAQLLVASQKSCHGPLETILTSTRYLLEQGVAVPPPMLAFFRSCGIFPEDLSPKLLKSIGSIVKDLDHELFLFEKSLYFDAPFDTPAWALSSRS